jgi:hypothetical protein
MNSTEKEQYKTVFKQSNALELFGACGYCAMKKNKTG